MNWDYDKKSPITGNKSVMVEDDTELCLESGYQFDGSIQTWWQEYEEKCPDIIKDSVFIDSDARRWYKSMLFSRDSLLVPVENGWEVNTFRDLYVDELENGARYEMMREIMTADNRKLIEVLDPNQARHFIEFIEALDEFTKRTHDEN